MSFATVVVIAATVITVKGVCTPNITEGTYGLWSTWSNCSVTCGGGSRWRSKGLCCPTVNGNLIDCRSTYNLTEVVLYDYSNCSQTCNHGKYVSGGCVCSDGYTGSCCSTDIDDCRGKPCQNNGSCVNQVNSYTCACQTGFTGKNCETDINEYDGDPCFNGGTCDVEVGNFKCTCLQTSVSYGLSPVIFKHMTQKKTLKTMAYTDKTTTTTMSRFSGRNVTASQLKNNTIDGDACTKSTCSVLMTCTRLSGGGHHCDCEKVGDTNLCLYELLIILGSLAIAAATSCLVVFFVVKRKGKIRDTEAPLSEK